MGADSLRLSSPTLHESHRCCGLVFRTVLLYVSSCVTCPTSFIAVNTGRIAGLARCGFSFRDLYILRVGPGRCCLYFVHCSGLAIQFGQRPAQSERDWRLLPVAGKEVLENSDFRGLTKCCYVAMTKVCEYEYFIVNETGSLARSGLCIARGER